MNTTLNYWILYSLIETIALVYYYKKISKAKKMDYRLALLCCIFVLMTDILSVFHYFIRYILLFVQPLFLYLYFKKNKEMEKYIVLFISLFLYIAKESSETFFSVIISSVVGDQFVYNNWGLFFTSINLLSFFFILRAIAYFKFDMRYFFKNDFKDCIFKLNIWLLSIHILLNFSHWISNVESLNSFSSMIATICFLMFMSVLFYLQSIREKYEKEEEIKQKKYEQLQLQKYTDEIVELYNEIRGFRHDYGGMLVSMRAGIATGDIHEIERIYDEVLVKANQKLCSDKYTSFDLTNVKDAALRSVMAQALFKARDYAVEITFEVKDMIPKLPIELLDLVRMMSILLNNAVEGAAESYQKKMNVSLVDMDIEIILIIQNSRKRRPIDLEELYQTDYSTKGEGRGLGLSNIKKIIDRYESIILDTEIDEEHFTQIMRIRKEGF